MSDDLVVDSSALVTCLGHVPATYTIATRDIKEAVEALEARGVTFESGVLEFPWGSIARFEDPDGNRLQLREGR